LVDNNDSSKEKKQSYLDSVIELQVKPIENFGLETGVLTGDRSHFQEGAAYSAI
jgi:hypothetical protein